MLDRCNFLSLHCRLSAGAVSRECPCSAGSGGQPTSPCRNGAIRSAFRPIPSGTLKRRSSRSKIASRWPPIWASTPSNPRSADANERAGLSAQAQAAKPYLRLDVQRPVNPPELSFAGTGKTKSGNRHHNRQHRAGLLARHSHGPHQHGSLGHDQKFRRIDGASRHRIALAGLYRRRRLSVGHREHRKMFADRRKVRRGARTGKSLGIGATPVGLLRIVNAVHSPWLGVTLDTGNFLKILTTSSQPSPHRRPTCMPDLFRRRRMVHARSGLRPHRGPASQGKLSRLHFAGI